MSRKTTILPLKDSELEYLNKIIKSRTIEVRVYKRSMILLLKHEGLSIKDIADKLDVTKPTINLCLNKYKKNGVDAALNDDGGRGRKAEIFDDAKMWVINIACQKPTEYGLSGELWYPVSLTRYVNSVAESAGYPRLATASVTSIRKILREAKLNPHKITYYCEKRDPNFEEKMHNVLVAYKQVELRFDKDGKFIPFEQDERPVHTISYDEKPGIQAISTTGEDKMPIPNTDKISTILRDYEYVRLGTVSLLAGIDLLTGEAIPLVSDTHKSSDYVSFLKKLDNKYPKGDKIRLILDNHSAHTSKETQEYLNTVPDRFEFVFTPTHGSWLNLIEGFFSKMTRQMLAGIRVDSKDELVERIYLYFDEINAVPVPYKWKYKMDDISSEENINQIVYEVVNAKAASVENKSKRSVPPIKRKPRVKSIN